MLPDEKIIKTVEGLERIVVIGFIICANNSLAFAKDLPLNKISSDKEGGHPGLIPVAIVEEANQVKTVLGTKFKDVRVEVALGLCNFSSDSIPGELGGLSHCNNTQAVVALSCAGGVAVLNVRLGKAVEVIPGHEN